MIIFFSAIIRYTKKTETDPSHEKIEVCNGNFMAMEQLLKIAVKLRQILDIHTVYNTRDENQLLFTSI